MLKLSELERLANTEGTRAALLTVEDIRDLVRLCRQLGNAVARVAAGEGLWPGDYAALAAFREAL